MPSVRVRDDLGRDLTFYRSPTRVVSLVPSDTHTVVALGCGQRLVGRTRYCVDAEALDAAVIGGTKDVDVDAVLALAPELVIANQEENTRGPLERLAAQVPVLVSLPRRVADGFAHVARLARILGVAREPQVVELVRAGYQLATAPPPPPTRRVFCPIWLDPLMTFNGETFGSDVLARVGAANVFGDRQRLYPLAADLGKTVARDAPGRDVRYPRITGEEVRARGADLIVLPDEPHDFTAAEEAMLAELIPGAGVVRARGRDLFWYGAWSLEALPRLRRALLAAT